MNSARLWVARERREGKLRKRHVGQAMLWFALYRLGKTGMEETVRTAVRSLEGLPEAELRARSLEFWTEELVSKVRRAVPDVLAAHQRQGDLRVLLSGTSAQLAAACAAHFGLDGALSTTFEVADGLFTGRNEEPLCYGAGKLHHATQFADQHGITLDQCSFYTDSYSDLPMLEAVGTPVVVDPDRRLLRKAQRRGWQVADWD